MRPKRKRRVLVQHRQTPYFPEETNKNFFVPKTLASDFEKFLSGHIPGAVMPFETLHDWYAQFDSQYKKVFWNGEIYANPSKSRYSNEDNHLEIRFARYADVRKGDYIIDQDRVIYLLDWVIGPENNNKPSRCLRCNAKITFKKYVEEEVSWEGKVIKPQHWDEFVKDIPCNAYRYEGRPQFSAVNGTPGISANALTVLSIQYNEKTKNIQIGDVFTWGTQEYIVIDVNLNGMDISGNHGMLTLQARMSPGGDRSQVSERTGSMYNGMQRY